jgi:exonuclease SbcC
MTGGQYELRQKEQAANAAAQSGLGIDVFDHNNGSLRDVKTLSGGEGFKASLALALGLSDIVRSCSGYIELDAMFVDEGFGNLDDNSLKTSIDALQNIAGDNRSIGIISHVGELAQMIDKQIIVTKDSQGSRVR